jgi:hypothetical protein
MCQNAVYRDNRATHPHVLSIGRARATPHVAAAAPVAVGPAAAAPVAAARAAAARAAAAPVTAAHVAAHAAAHAADAAAHAAIVALASVGAGADGGVAPAGDELGHPGHSSG